MLKNNPFKVYNQMLCMGGENGKKDIKAKRTTHF